MGHRATLYNDEAEQIFFQNFGEDLWTTVVGDIESTPNAPERHIYGDTGNIEGQVLFQVLLEEIQIGELADRYKEVLQEARKMGATSFGSRLREVLWVKAFYHLFRREGKLPQRFGWTMELHNGMIRPDAATKFYSRFGPQWVTMEQNPWFYQMGISSEGAWDSVQRACLGPDLEAKSSEKKAEEKCPEPDERGWQTMQNSIESGYRIAGLHGVGSDGIRRVVQMIETAIEESGQLNRDMVREMRTGLAHGTMAGKPSVVVDDVFEKVKDLNIYVPIQVVRAIEEEPEVIIDRYGDEALEFLAPVRSLLDAGVKVVGETEELFQLADKPNASYYFKHLNAYVNRTAPETEVWVSKEGIGRVEALKLLTIRSAEFIAGEEFVGSLEPGKFADFVVIENDVLEASKDQLRDNKVIMVGLDGEIEHQTDEAKEAISIEKPTEC